MGAGYGRSAPVRSLTSAIRRASNASLSHWLPGCSPPASMFSETPAPPVLFTTVALSYDADSLINTLLDPTETSSAVEEVN
jgi:hypothetical protein